MKNFKRTAILSISMVMILSSTLVFAKKLAGGDLIYDGGQTDTKVYSKIFDRRPDDGRLYKVKATVKVGGNKYTSGWKNDRAYKQADRKWYANETSHYDFYRRN
ncbi:hypothetical protein [Dethiothermospora halolimnae]|uniref:hypothetical protein n=1 Tax=Dethiothermospora halolimnae TaxID=3114390 RepID=UPI003CCBF4D4